MDPFDDLLRHVRAAGGGLRRTTIDGKLTFPDGFTLCALASGEASTGEETVRAGDIVIAKGPFTLHGQATVVSGTYDITGARRLTAVLPNVLIARGTEECAQFYRTLDHGGPQVVADRLLDWLMVCGLRTWFDREHETGWLGALADDVAGPALRAMHAAPERPWTLAQLAAEVGVSRTTFATRFAAKVGVPPLTYLTDWRMTVAADLLASSNATVAAVARQVGYADAFGFSAAFKRVHGISPSECRAGCAATA